MKIVRLAYGGTLPEGWLGVAALSRKSLGKKRTEALRRVPHGRALTKSLRTHTHTAVLKTDADRLGWPVVAYGIVYNGKS